MPRRTTPNPTQTLRCLQNVSCESVAVSWLMRDGWQVFRPVLDHGHKTDLLISDGPNFFRIQIKTVTASKKQIVENLWGERPLDYVIYFVRNGDWGVIAPAFAESKRVLRHREHRLFRKNCKDFLRSFHLV